MALTGAILLHHYYDRKNLLIYQLRSFKDKISERFSAGALRTAPSQSLSL